MATYTTNLNLKKPAQSDKVRIADFNNNADLIDAAIGAVGDGSLMSMANAMQDALAIVADGDTHVAITAGQFVYVKNNEHGLADGLYVASAAVAANGSISADNMTADSKGGLNALGSRKINYYSALLQTTLTTSYVETPLRSGYTLADYEVIILGFYRGDWIVGTVTVPRAQFANATGVAFVAKWGSNEIEYDVKYVSDTAVSIKKITSDSGNHYLRIFGLKND